MSGPESIEVIAMKLFNKWFRRPDTEEAAAIERYERWREFRVLEQQPVHADESRAIWPPTLRIIRDRSRRR